MKRTITYDLAGKTVRKDVTHIPVRYILAIMLTVLEVLAVIGIVVALCRFVPCFHIAAWLTQIACVIRIIASDDNPDYKVPWLLFVLILPVAGFMLYFMFYSRRLKRKYSKRMAELRTSAYKKDDASLFRRLRQENPAVSNQARMLCGISGAHLFSAARLEYFPLGEHMRKSLLRDLKKAEKFIFMEYFIIEEGVFWDSVLEILKEKASAGVEVRVLYDDIGCMATLPGGYCKTLRRLGIQAAVFSRLKGAADSEFNNRSHRKIAVIDGNVGYTGGINIADEYINETHPLGHWKDTALRLEGEAVRELTRMFLLDYGINVAKLPPETTDYFPPAEDTDADGARRGYIVPFGDGPRPMYTRRVGKSVIQNILAAATRYVWMTSPYLIIDNELCQSIENAALRGVDVKIIVPRIPDKKLVFEMTRSFYPRLMESGVEIHEYEPGFIHAKSYLADDELAMIGTINLDYRSLVHHFENGVWLYRCDAIRALKSDITETLAKSVRMTPKAVKAGLAKRAFRAVARIFAPLM